LTDSSVELINIFVHNQILISTAYIFTAWVPIFTFPANKQPYIVTGNYVTAGFGLAAVATVLLMRHLHNKDLTGQKEEPQSVSRVEYSDVVA
jgi:hypothetical protein